MDKMDRGTNLSRVRKMEYTVDPFWFFWGVYMFLVGYYLYDNCERQRRNIRRFEEYQEFIRQSDLKLERLEQQR
jgi:hypothetical protein